MALNGPLADIQICSDVLVRLTGEYLIHNLALTWSERRETIRSAPLPSAQLTYIMRLFERASDAGDEVATSNGLLDEVRRAGFHGHHCHLHIAVAGNQDRRQLTLLGPETKQQFKASHARKIEVNEKTAFTASVIAFEKGFACLEVLDCVSLRFEGSAKCLSDVMVVVNDKDDGIECRRRDLSSTSRFMQAIGGR